MGEKRERWLHLSIREVMLLWRYMAANLSYWEVWMTVERGMTVKFGTWIRRPGRRPTSPSTSVEAVLPLWPRLRKLSANNSIKYESCRTGPTSAGRESGRRCKACSRLKGRPPAPSNRIRDHTDVYKRKEDEGWNVDCHLAFHSQLFPRVPLNT